MMLKNQATSKRSRKNYEEEFLDECDIEEEGFIDGEINLGKVLSTFNFGMHGEAENKDLPNEHSFKANVSEPSGNSLFNIHIPHADLYASTSAPRGLTPPINGESFTVKRAYAMRPSTVRKLNALKAQHPDVNMLFNTLVDMAITHYYNYIMCENGSFQGLKENKATS